MAVVLSFLIRFMDYDIPFSILNLFFVHNLPRHCGLYFHNVYKIGSPFHNEYFMPSINIFPLLFFDNTCVILATKGQIFSAYMVSFPRQREHTKCINFLPLGAQLPSVKGFFSRKNDIRISFLPFVL